MSYFESIIISSRHCRYDLNDPNEVITVLNRECTNRNHAVVGYTYSDIYPEIKVTSCPTSNIGFCQECSKSLESIHIKREMLRMKKEIQELRKTNNQLNEYIQDIRDIAKLFQSYSELSL